jgi:hypothetical protein
MLCVLQSLCIVFCSHSALCSAVTVHCVLQSPCILFCSHCSLCSAGSLLLLNNAVSVAYPVQVERLQASLVGNTVAQLVSVFVFHVSLVVRHRTRSLHLGVHFAVTQLPSRVQFIGRPLINGSRRDNFSDKVFPVRGKSGVVDGHDCVSDCVSSVTDSCLHSTVRIG